MLENFEAMQSGLYSTHNNSTVKLAYILLVVLIFWIIFKRVKKRASRKYEDQEYEQYTRNDQINLNIENQDEEEGIGQNYQRKWLLTYHEKYAYEQIKQITEKYNLTLFTKVRLFDLVEPRKGNPKYKTYLYKIQAKHVDFVICDTSLVARYVIELDDRSHDTPERRKRDAFVDAVLKATGYKILHIRNIDKNQIEKFLQQ